MKAPQALVLVGVLLVAGLSLAIALPRGAVPGLIDITADHLPPAPEIVLASPTDGEGVSGAIHVAGTATTAERQILDVEYRVDGGRWDSAPLQQRGQRVAPFEVDVNASPGDHVVEVRAFDGELMSIPARAEVRQGAPTLEVVQPHDGDGVTSGAVVVAGIVRGSAERVSLVIDDNATTSVAVSASGTWSTSMEIPAGEHVVRAIAVGPIDSIPRALRVAADDPAPPSLSILAPEPGSAFGQNGDPKCPGSCILFAGIATSATRVAVQLDGVGLGDATLAPEGGSWAFRLPIVTVANGTHVATFRPIGGGIEPGVARSITFQAHTSISLVVRGEERAQFTGTPLAFSVVGDGAEGASWSIDGEPVAHGASVIVSFDRAGDHLLSVRATGTHGRIASATVPLHAIDRAPDLAFVGEPTMVDGKILLRVAATDSDGVVVNYRWTFGDGSGTNTTNASVLHSYRSRGAYTAEVTAIDDDGSAATLSEPLVVANAPPVAAFNWTPEAPTILDTVTLHDASFDHDGTIAERAWIFDDGNRSSAASPTLRFRTHGAHNETLRVLDDLGAITEITQAIDVRDIAPNASFRFDPPIPLTHQDVTFADASTDIDGPIVSWHWSFGDNATHDSRTALHAYATSGNYSVTLTITDDAGLTSNLTRNITIADRAPDVRNVTLDPPNPTALQPTAFHLVADERLAPIVAAHWEFGDATTSNESAPLHAYARSGLYDGSVTAYDAAGLTTTFPFTVSVQNALPEANLTVAPGGSFAGYPTILTANATDPDGRISYYRFDADNDGVYDCQTTEPTCAFVYEKPGSYDARLLVDDDEGGEATTERIIDITLPAPDHPPPTITIESPQRDTTLRGQYLIRGNAHGPRNVTTVELQLRMGAYAYSGTRDAWHLATGTTEWHALLNTQTFPNGDYDLVIRATDDASGTGYQHLPIHIDNADHPTLVTLQLAPTPPTLDKKTTLRGSAFHPEGITNIRYRIDSNDWTTLHDNPLAFEITLDPTTLRPGTHVLRIEAYHGITDTNNATLEFQVPGTTPHLIIDDTPNQIAHALIRANGRILGQGRAQWKLDQGTWHDLPPGPTWNLTIDTLPYHGGHHTLALRAESPDETLHSDPTTYPIDVINPPFLTPETPPAAPTPAHDVPAPATMLLAIVIALAAASHRKRS